MQVLSQMQIENHHAFIFMIWLAHFWSAQYTIHHSVGILSEAVSLTRSDPP